MISKFKELFVQTSIKIKTATKTAITQGLGEINWQPPLWVEKFAAVRARFVEYCKLNKKKIVIRAAISLPILIFLFAALMWYSHLPKPHFATLTVEAPPLTRLVEEKWIVNPLNIVFNESVAPLDKTGKTIADGIKISPAIEGEWKWDGDRILRFMPNNNWGIGVNYKVSFDKKLLFRNGIKLKDYFAEFSSAPFKASIDKSAFYQDPQDPNMKKIVVTVSFSHPVDDEDFKNRAEMIYKENKSGVIGSVEKDYPVNVSFDKFKMFAYLSSDPVPLPEKESEMLVRLDSGIRCIRGGPATTQPIEKSVAVPSITSFLKIDSIKPALVDNERFEPEQIIVVDSTIGLSDKEIDGKIRAYVLPIKNPAISDEEQGDAAYEWYRPEEIDDAVLKKSERLELDAIDTDKEYSSIHSYKYSADVGRFVFVEVAGGLAGYGGYTLKEDKVTTFKVPEYPKELKILHSGSILNIGGERKAAAYARDITAVKIKLSRVMPDQIQHMVTQTSGTFGSPEFNNYTFDEENLSRVFTEEIKLPYEGPGKAQYFSIDLGKYMDNASGTNHKGLFVLRLKSFDPKKKPQSVEDDWDPDAKEDSRFILVTDLGAIAKKAADGSFDLFVQSIKDGVAVGSAEINVIGKNGLKLLTQVTDADGRARFPTLKDFKNDQTPVLFLIEKDGDLSFLPYKKADRTLDMSSFDIGGATNQLSPDDLSAYLFSDRKLYRPGETMNIGLIVKPSAWGKKIEGIPLEVRVTDARGLLVKKEKIKIGAAGFEEFKYKTEDSSPTGTYSISLHMIKDDQHRYQEALGSVNVRVQEFLPDRMRITAGFAPEIFEDKGWIDPLSLKGVVNLQNLFGTPAESKIVAATMELNPVLPSFPAYKDFQFYDPMRAKESFSETLIETKTDGSGSASFDLNLQRFATATYKLKFVVRGFEAAGGRSVAAESSAIVSPLKLLVGYKTDGDLSYINRESKHKIEFVAIDPSLAKTAAENLKAVVIERKYVSVLTKQDDGTYKYESIRKEVPLSETPFSIPAKGLSYSLATSNPGDFAIEIRGGDNSKLARVEYTVAGTSNVTRSLEKNALLQIALSKKDYDPGEEIEMQIKAPYVGSGLITIEREKVFASSWFKTTETSSVQKIKLPDDFEGNGYVSVAFVRDFNSEEIFMSPLSYGTVPFSSSLKRRTSKISLSSADEAKPGTDYTVEYKTESPSKIVIFAVDEGILQAAGYKLPNPLGFFFRKRQLEVSTSQILDLILPEFKRLVSLAAPGGDEDDALGKNLNPFKKKRQGPVAFWSGIIDSESKARRVKFPIPDYFNGTLRVMAVAVAQDSVGVEQKKATLANDLVITPNTPVFAAPGDEFDVTVAVANAMKNADEKSQVEIAIEVPSNLEVVGETKSTLLIPKGRELSAIFKLKAKDAPGDAEILFKASSERSAAKISESVSVRPATAYMTTFDTGTVKNGNMDVAVKRVMYPNFATNKAGIGALPLMMSHGLTAYLEDFPYSCTEQLVSQSFSAMLLQSRKEFGFDLKKAEKAFSDLTARLATRQNARGSFGMWAANTYNTSDYISVYAIHFLLDSKDRGFAVSQDMINKGLKWAAEFAAAEKDNLEGMRAQAYAIYVLTRSGKVTTNLLTALNKRLDEMFEDEWKSDLAAIYLAGSYAQLKQTKQAKRLLDAHLAAKKPVVANYEHFYDELSHEAQLLYIVSRHFPDELGRISPDLIGSMTAKISKSVYNTFSSAYSLMALDAYATAVSAEQTGGLSIAAISGGGKQTDIPLPQTLLPVIDIPDATSAIRFSNASDVNAFYMLRQSGFDATLPLAEIKENMEVIREFTDLLDKPVTEVKAGAEILAHLKIRSLGSSIWNAAVVDLLPAGFEIVIDRPAQETPDAVAQDSEESYDEDCEDCEGAEGDDSAEEYSPEEGDTIEAPQALPIAQPKSSWLPVYADIREDRVVLYGKIEPTVSEFIYKIRATAAGNFTVPPVYAESMYDRTCRARSMAGKIKVLEDK